MWCLLLTCCLVATLPPTASAQTRKSATPPARVPVIRRAGTPAEIEAAAGGLIAALAQVWPGGEQQLANLKGCELTLLTKKSVGDLVTEDFQVVDAGDLALPFEEREDVLAGTIDVRFTRKDERAFVRRVRRQTLEGVRRTPTENQVIFFAVSFRAPDSEKRRMDKLTVLMQFADKCERVR